MTYLIALFAMPFDDNTWSVSLLQKMLSSCSHPCTKSALVYATTCTTSPLIAFAARVIVVELVVV